MEQKDPATISSYVYLGCYIYNTLFLQGIRPTTWWEKGKADKSTLLPITLWLVLLALLDGLMQFYKVDPKVKTTFSAK